jgi:hypothetical protein
VRRTAAVILPALGLLVALGLPGAPAVAGEPAPRWGFGWDPGDRYNGGLTLRHRFGQAWEIGLAAGPDDYKEDEDILGWDSDDPPASVDARAVDDYRRESGWVRATAARCFWRDGPFAAAALAGLTYNWSNVQRIQCYPRNTETADADVYNWRQNSRSDLWRFTLGLRPSWAPTARLTVEFEAGLAFETWTGKTRSDTWYDYDPRIIRDSQDRLGHAFFSYGGCEWSRLKFIFWF